MSNTRLTDKQQAFVEHYLRTWNATDAARLAGYSERSARQIGQQNLSKVDIAAEIRARLTELRMSADEVLIRTADIARGDLSAWITEDGEVDIALLKASGKGYLLKKYRVTRRSVTTKSGNELETVTTEIELYPADAAHDRLMRYHGLYNDKVRVVAWQDEIVGLLQSGAITPDDVIQELGDDLARELFDAGSLSAVKSR